MKEINLDSNLVNTNPNPIPNKNNKPEPKVSTPKSTKKKTVKVFEKFKNLNKTQKVIIIGSFATFLIITAGLITYLTLFRKPETQNQNSLLSADKSSENNLEKIDAVDPEPPKDHHNPITGQLLTETEYEELTSKQPIAVMIENHTAARPQSGYNSADIVYETLAEGGITRTVAVFWSKTAGSIGPIRSARQYFIEYIYPYDPLFMFIGYAYSDDPRVNAGGTIMNNGMKRLDTANSFWRINTRFAPHNAYSSQDRMYQIAAQKGYTEDASEFESWKFKSDDKAEDRGQSTTANLVFMQALNNGGAYDVVWTYDPETNGYFRYVGGAAHIDEDTNSQVWAKNIAIQKTSMISTYDFAAHIIVTTQGEGDATILRDGQVINGTWQKNDMTSRITFYDSNYEEIEFNRGTTWVEGVPTNEGSVIIES